MSPRTGVCVCVCWGGGEYNSEVIMNTTYTLFTVSRFSGQERRGTPHRLNQWQIQTLK